MEYRAGIKIRKKNGIPAWSLAPETGPHQPHMGIVLQRLDAGTTLQSAEVRAWGGQAVGT